MSKSDKLRAIKKALQPPQAQMDKIYINDKFYCEVQGTGKKRIVSSQVNADLLKEFLTLN